MASISYFENVKYLHCESDKMYTKQRKHYFTSVLNLEKLECKFVALEKEM
jgi:hypothetical protein